MKGILKSLFFGGFVVGMSFIAGCHTVSGTVEGMGKDVNSITGGSATKHHAYHRTTNQNMQHKAAGSKQMKKTTTTTTTQESNMSNSNMQTQ